MPLTPLDLISTPVPVLGSTDLVTHVGISGDDPLSERFRDETYRVFVSMYDRQGTLVDRPEFEPIGAGQRRLLPVSELVGNRSDGADVLAVVHRVPTSVSPIGSDPTLGHVGELTQESYQLYRSVLQLSRAGGGHGSVIYETPPTLNDLRARPKPSSALMFTSKVLVGARADTTVVALHHSLDPGYSTTARLRLRVFDPAGEALAQTELEIPAFSVLQVPLHKLLASAGVIEKFAARSCSVVAWSRDAALLFLIVQTADEGRAVAVEHTHPPQTYLIPKDPALRFRIKEAAIAHWDECFVVGANGSG